jgi:transcriptional regulator with XRE-family HTH domain
MPTATLDQLLNRRRAHRRLPGPEARRLLREEVGVTQADVAALLDSTPSSVSRYESGARTPRGATLERYVEILDRFREEIGAA